MGVFLGLKLMTRPKWKLSIRTAIDAGERLSETGGCWAAKGLHSCANTDTSADFQLK